MKVACLLMAAGAGSRFGGRKQLAEIAGAPMIQHTLTRLLPIFGGDLYAVIGAYREEVRPLVSPYARVIEHPGWDQGLGSSIALGVRQIRPSNYDGVLIALADQVSISTKDYAALLAQFDGTAIVAAQYAKKFAVPALFPACCFDDLSRLQGDKGARQLLQAPRLPLIGVPMPQAQEDIDRASDLTAVDAHSARGLPRTGC